MKALSIRQPWAWLICNAGKNIENRTWPTKFRGQFAVHAAKGMTNIEYEDVYDFLASSAPNIEMPPMAALERGGIVGIANITDCVTRYESPWFFGPHGFVLRDARPVPFVPFKGALGFFDVPDDLVLP